MLIFKNWFTYTRSGTLYSVYTDSTTTNETFPATSSPIGVTNVNCVGTENKLAECTYEPVYLNTSCIHQNDAGVRCSSCTKGGMRIVGASNNMGHVELCLYGDWVSVCASGWTIMDSNTVCSLFGYPINGWLHTSLLPVFFMNFIIIHKMVAIL